MLSYSSRRYHKVGPLYTLKHIFTSQIEVNMTIGQSIMDAKKRSEAYVKVKHNKKTQIKTYTPIKSNKREEEGTYLNSEPNAFTKHIVLISLNKKS